MFVTLEERNRFATFAGGGVFSVVPVFLTPLEPYSVNAVREQYICNPKNGCRRKLFVLFVRLQSVAILAQSQSAGCAHSDLTVDCVSHIILLWLSHLRALRTLTCQMRKS